MSAGLVLALMGVGTAGVAEASTATTQEAAAAQAAPPRGKAAATSSPLYKTGTLARSNCAPGEIQRGSTAAYKHFLQAFTNCLNRAWASEFKQARLPFAKPRLRIITSKRNTACGRWLTGASGVYCSADRTMYMLITKTELRNPSPVGIGRLMAHEYGHHVQQIAGIMPWYAQASWRASKSAKLAYSRRLELQAECMSAVFMKSVKDTLPVDEAYYQQIIDWFGEKGASIWPQNDHGSSANQARWMQRGWDYGAPAACNTWTSPARYVS
ncbi:neutral zinc metallopeptidase [Nonomuraea sp. NPDC004354]